MCPGTTAYNSAYVNYVKLCVYMDACVCTHILGNWEDRWSAGWNNMSTSEYTDTHIYALRYNIYYIPLLYAHTLQSVHTDIVNSALKDDLCGTPRALQRFPNVDPSVSSTRKVFAQKPEDWVLNIIASVLVQILDIP